MHWSDDSQMRKIPLWLKILGLGIAIYLIVMAMTTEGSEKPSEYLRNSHDSSS